MFPSRCSSLLVAAILCPTLAHAADPDPAEARNAMAKAVTFFREHLSVEGGYATQWTLDPVIGYTEHHESPTVFSIQPHGTTTVGLAMLEAYRATGERLHLEAAAEAGAILARCQLSTGGWYSDFDFSSEELLNKTQLRTDTPADIESTKKRPRLSTLDDNKTQSALMLLLELSIEEGFAGKQEIEEALRFGLDALLAAQHPDGSWPQQFDGPADPNAPVLSASLPDAWSRTWPDEDYYRLPTLNDGNLLAIAKVLLRAHEITGEERYLDSVKRLGEFFLRVQLPAPQAGWAQQYDENRQPCWARKFEPPAVASTETWDTVEALFELWLATGDDRLRDAIPPALDWLENSRIPEVGWARFYELETNKPLYFTTKYELTYDDSDLPTHYGFQVGDGMSGKIIRMREMLERSREDWLAKREAEQSPEGKEKYARSLRSKVADALTEQHENGYWTKGDRVDAGEFVKRMNALNGYVAGTR